MTKEQHTLLARCYVALAEVDYDLRQWSKEVRVGIVLPGAGVIVLPEAKVAKTR